jgi:hypothetical protein
MIELSLPRTLTVAGKEYRIRADFRDVITLMCVLDNSSISEMGKVYSVLRILYADTVPTQIQEAVNEAMWFIDGGRSKNLARTHGPAQRNIKLMDWEQDFPLIIAPVNRIAGCDIRGLPFYHWWSFLSCFQEIGDCLFARVNAIRYKRGHHKKLDEAEQEFFRQNKELILFRRKKNEINLMDEEFNASTKAFIKTLLNQSR